MAEAHATGTVPVTIIELSRNWLALDLKELWDYRELLYSDLARCKGKVQTNNNRRGLGDLGTVHHMVIFTLVFKKIAALSEHQVTDLRLHGSLTVEPVLRRA